MIDRPIRRRGRYWSFTTLVVILLVGQLGWLRPVRSFIGGIVSAPGTLFDRAGQRIVAAGHVFFSINDLARENQGLTTTNNELQAKLAALQSVQAENERLRQDLGFNQTRPDLTFRPAQIVGFSPISNYQSVRLDQGTAAGIHEGDAVVSAGFLIGRVVSADSGSAQVSLVTNRDAAVPVVLSSSQTVGLLRGGIRGLIVDTIPTDTKVAVGEQVVTSALEGLYPAGLAVGTVNEIISRKEEVFITLRVSSPINIGNLTTVFVVTKK
jgi:rod shape-determining protein MreC